jgi:fluoride exporter
MKNFLLVGVGGYFGAMARYGVGIVVARFWPSDFPLATLLINVSGSFVLGLFATLAAERYALDPAWRLVVATGFVGAYTTFSTFEYETQRLAEAGSVWWALLNVATSVVVGYAAVQLGVSLAR